MTTTFQQTGEFIPRNYDVFAGLDVDKTSISVNILTHEKTVKSMQIPNHGGNLIGYMRKNFPDQKVAFAYEAGPTGFGLYDQLAQQGYTCLVVSPSMVPTAPGARVKTNRLDSKKISESLRGGQLKSIHVPSPVYRDLRHLVHLRDTAVRQATAAKLRIKSMLLFESIAFPEAAEGGQWSSEVIAELKTLPCSATVRFKLKQLLLSLQFARTQVLTTMKEIRRFCNEEAQLKSNLGFLTSIPGIGQITATHLLARIADPKEILNVRQLGCFFGLTQRESSTGDSVNKGSITRYGDSRLRNKLIQAAWAAIRKDLEFKEFYQRIYQRHPKDRAAKKAIVAVARKMTTRIYSVLHEQRNYEIRHKISSDSLIQEETLRPRERLDAEQNKENLDSLNGSVFETEIPGQFIPGKPGRLAQQESKPGCNAPEGTHLNTVRQYPACATDSSKSVLRLKNRQKNETNLEIKEQGKWLDEGDKKPSKINPSPPPWHGGASPSRGEARRGLKT